MQQNSSLAYDLSVYDEQQQRRSRLRVVERQKSAKHTLEGAFTIKALGAFFIVITLLGLMVFNNARLNEISGDLSAVQREITRMESEEVVMRSQLSAMASLEVVAQRAQELGMHRLEPDQIRHVNLYSEDRIISRDNRQQAPPQGISVRIQGLLGRVMEYIA